MQLLTRPQTKELQWTAGQKVHHQGQQMMGYNFVVSGVTTNEERRRSR